MSSAHQQTDLEIVELMREERIEPCAFVLSVDENGKPSGMMAGWNMKCSYEPPMWAVAVSKNKYTHKLITQSGEFVIAVPDQTMEDSVRIFGTTHGDVVEKFDITKIRTLDPKIVRTPLLANAIANYECKVQGSYVAGHHTVFFGKVVAATLGNGTKQLFKNGRESGEHHFSVAGD